MMGTKKNEHPVPSPLQVDAPPEVRMTAAIPAAAPRAAVETGGPAGLEPTRYGDWERRGRCIDF